MFVISRGSGLRDKRLVKPQQGLEELANDRLTAGKRESRAIRVQVVWLALVQETYASLLRRLLSEGRMRGANNKEGCAKKNRTA